MAIKKKKKRKVKLEIDLTGPEGNAFALLGLAQQYAHELGFDFVKIEEEMQSGDYENLVQTFDKYFGNYVDLLR